MITYAELERRGCDRALVRVLLSALQNWAPPDMLCSDRDEVAGFLDEIRAAGYDVVKSPAMEVE